MPEKDEALLDCQQNFIAHDAMLKKHDEAMDKIAPVIAQLPLQMQHLTQQIEELCKTMRAQSSSFVSKDSYDTRKADVDRHLADIDKNIDELWVAKGTLDKKYDEKIDKLKTWIYGIIIGCLATIAWAFVWKHFSGG